MNLFLLQKLRNSLGVHIVPQQVKNQISIHEDVGQIPDLTQQGKVSGIALSCSVSCRHGSDLVLLWLWHRLADASSNWTSSLGLPYAVGMALKRQKKKKRERNSLVVCQNNLLGIYLREIKTYIHTHINLYTNVYFLKNFYPVLCCFIFLITQRILLHL